MPSLAITGSPAVGKTTVAQLMGQQGWEVLSVSELAKTFDCQGVYDEAMKSQEIDIHKLAEEFLPGANKQQLIDGHLSHFLSVDRIVLLRCEPGELRQRLKARGYDDAKITANVEWELLAGTWAEIIEFDITQPILELDASKLSAEQVVNAISTWLTDDLDSTLPENAIDWLGKR